jgi:hypothetical protein
MLVSGLTGSTGSHVLSQTAIAASTVSSQDVSNSSLSQESTVAVPTASDSSDNEGSAKTSSNSVNTGKNAGLDGLVRDFSSDKPLMAEISYCESRFRQYDKDGSVLRGIANPDDVGLFQINEHYHLERAKKMGYDIYSPEGNMAYARVIFNEQGPQPWSASSPCWKKTVAYKNYVAEHGDVLAMSK